MSKVFPRLRPALYVVYVTAQPRSLAMGVYFRKKEALRRRADLKRAGERHVIVVSYWKER